MAKKISFFDGAESSTTPTVGNLAASELVTYPDDATFEATEQGAPKQGNIYYNTTTDKIRYYNGTTWETLPTEAVEVNYDNSTSMLSATDVQAAIDEVEGRVDTNETNISDNATDILNLETLSGSPGDTDHGTFTGTTIPDNSDTKESLQALETEVETKIPSTEKGSANGVASLDGTGRIPSAQLPTTALEYKGSYDASGGGSGSPSLTDGTGDTGDFYRVSAAGTVDHGAGNVTYAVGDSVIYNGTTWDKYDEQTLTDTDALPEGSLNLYYTNTRADARIAAASVDDLSDVDTSTSAPNTNDVLAWDGSNWVPDAPSGGGGGGSGEGGINYITNPDAETDTSDWTTYDDGASSTPVDGTGGSPGGIALSRITSNQLRGVGSFRITKSLGDYQGEGVSTDFSIDNQDVDKVLNISFDYTTSASYSGVNNSLKVFVYDVDNATMLTPSENEIAFGTNTRFSSRFQATDSLNYRLIFHVSVTDVDTYLFDYDRVSVGPDVVVPGAIITEWEEITDISTLISWTTNSTHTAYRRRVGDTMEIEVKTALSGAPNATTYTITIPDGLSIDTSKQSTNTISGYAYLEDNSTAGNRTMAQMQILDANTVRPIAIGGSTVTQAAPFTWANNDKLVTNFRVPIDGWSAGASLSTTETLFSTPVLEAENSSSDTFNNSAPIQGWTTLKDNTNSFNASTGVYTVPSDGDYFVSTSFLVLTTTTAVAAIHINGTLYRGGPQSTSSKSKTISTIVSDLKAGDTIDIRHSSGTNSTLNATGTWSSLTIHKVQDFSVFSVYGNTKLVESKSSVSVSWPAAASAWGDVTSIDLTPGEWDITANYEVKNNGTGSAGNVELGISQTSGNSSTGLLQGDNQFTSYLASPSNGVQDLVCCPRYNLIVTENTTIYLKCRKVAVTNTEIDNYKISARKIK